MKTLLRHRWLFGFRRVKRSLAQAVAFRRSSARREGVMSVLCIAAMLWAVNQPWEAARGCTLGTISVVQDPPDVRLRPCVPSGGVWITAAINCTDGCGPTKSLNRYDWRLMGKNVDGA